MSEIINTYLLSDPDTLIPMDRDEFYAEQIAAYEKTGQPTRAVEIIDVFIFNRFGELLGISSSLRKGTEMMPVRSSSVLLMPFNISNPYPLL